MGQFALQCDDLLALARQDRLEQISFDFQDLQTLIVIREFLEMRQNDFTGQ